MANYQLSVCAEMVFLDLPFVERVARIDALGFGVEIWNWGNKDLDALVATGARFTSMTGYLSGNLTDEEDIAQLLHSARQSLVVAQRLNCPSLNLHGTGLDSQGLPVKPVQVVTGAMWMKAAETLTRLAQMGEEADKVFTLENLNLPLDHPGTPFAKAGDTLALVEAVNRPGLKMNLDLYHAQIGEGNLIALIRRCGPAIGEIQVADVPGRKQPGTGEINYRAIARTLDEIGYQGVVAMEGWAAGDSTEALQQFRDHFTL
ncbi:Hydroxypyruvate isomerase [Serratia proteamaculans]|uniref:TIM barrel protein n=1 Tax=Serratia proteamaculans TaxID=28151 RepID=UPI00101E9422|nr:TIM barrel protein [Serratia proteamaculans]KAB1498531.1 TIM barrel protein [Serratia proteamaculans]RYM52622.1 hydroxypyruvate isomerase [Serratia proteamaculans]RYM55983.1 hydroxypyruvate isomerase [Serratia proteamaculans]CAI0765302.1 Hydroxypyruvate isomerase [Serratia proteamaculans]CAI0785735.1 Hydroxypyruvate isomerase [Serratia proteamaculans]